MFYVNMVFSLIDKYCKKTKFYSIILLLRVIISNVNIFKTKHARISQKVILYVSEDKF